MTTPAESLEVMLARIDERTRAMQLKVDQIHVEVRVTNGRVTELEKWRGKRDAVDAERAEVRTEHIELRDQSRSFKVAMGGLAVALITVGNILAGYFLHVA